MRRAARVDQSQAPIVAALRASGAKVEIIGHPVDLLILFRGTKSLLECKTPGTKPRKDQKAQQEFCALWNVPVVHTVEDALRAVGCIRLAKRTVSEEVAKGTL